MKVDTRHTIIKFATVWRKTSKNRGEDDVKIIADKRIDLHSLRKKINIKGKIQ